MTCTDLEGLFDMREGELPERVAAELREHLAGCASCAAESKRLERLIGAIGADPPPSTLSVEAVMAAVKRPAPKPRRAGAAWMIGAMAASMVAALGASLVLMNRDRDTVTARGGGEPQSLEQQVGISVLAGEPLAPVVSGGAVPAGGGFSFAYRNLGSGDAWAMVFIVDANGALHWIYPAYTDAAQDPESVRLPPSRDDRVMPETVKFDDLPKGPAKIVTLVTAQPLKVKAIEAGGAQAAVARSLLISVR